jgi:multidrug resistance efflux pump
MARKAGKTIGGILPIFIWLASVGVVVVLYSQRIGSFTVQGIAYAPSQTVMAVENATIRHIYVQPCQAVRKGDLLALIELGNPLENEYARSLAAAQRATARAEMDRLRAELDAMQAELDNNIKVQQSEQSQAYRRLALDVERARLDLLDARATLEADRGMLAGLELEKKSLELLLERQAVDSYEVQRIRMEHESMARKVGAEEELVRQAQQNLSLAQNRLDQEQQVTLSDDYLKRLLTPFEKAVCVQEKYIEECFAPVSQLAVRAEIDGVVGSIAYNEGQSITPGLPILTVTSPDAGYVMIWLDQHKAGLVKENMPVELIKSTVPRSVIRSQVVSVGAAFEQIPAQLWVDPKLPLWGKPVRIAVPQGVSLVANELVGIRGL